MSEMSTPFKFLDSYTLSDRDIFFGREAEIDEVHAKIFQSKLLLVYGASGTGKSSIINCGLANRFLESDWLPINVRRGGNISRSMYNQIEKLALTPLRFNENQSIQEKTHKALSSVYLDYFKPIYLIFDQFEELFIFGMKEEWQEFIRIVRLLMDTELDIRFIFVLRGEYLQNLSEFEEIIPDFFDNRLRVEKMTRTKAIESITGPCDLFSIELEEGFEEKLLKKLSPDSSEVELTFLQVFLDKIYKKSLNSNGNQKLKFENKEIDSIGNLGDVLAEFLDEQLFKMEDPKAALVVIKSFVSLQGTKTQNCINEVVEYSNSIGNPIEKQKVESIIRSFVNKRILKDQDDSLKYELRHDSLAQKVFEKITLQEREILDVKHFLAYSLNEHVKRDFILNDEDLAYIGPHIRNMELDSETLDFIALSRKHSKKRQKAKKTRNIIGTVILALLVTSLLGLYYAKEERDKSNQLAEVAMKESEESQKQKIIAEDQKRIAEEKSVEAEKQAEIAAIEKNKAEQSNLEAQKQKAIALDQKQIAEQERMQAEASEQQALINEQEAERQKSIAESKSKEANRLKILTAARAAAIKSQQINDKELATLLSLQAYYFNTEYEGYEHQADIYHALYRSRVLNGLETSINSEQNQPILAIESKAHLISIISKSGKFIELKNNIVIRSSQMTQSGRILTSALILNNLIVMGTDDGEFLIYDSSSKSVILDLKLGQSPVSAISTSESQNSYYCAFSDGTLINVQASGEVLNRFKLEHEIADISFEANAQKLLILSRTGKLYELDKYGEINLKGEATNEKTTCLSINPKNSSEIAIGTSKGAIILFDIRTSKTKFTFSGHKASVTKIVFGQPNFMVSSSYDRSVKIWNLRELQEAPISIADHSSWVSQVHFDNEKSEVISGTFNGLIRKFPVKTETLLSGLCEKTSRNLSQKEWKELVSDDIPYELTCHEKN